MGMGLKKITSGTNCVVIVLLLAGILAIVNAFSFRHFFRIDLTENKQFTISDSTRKILAGLDDIVNIKVYLSRKLPPYMLTITDQVKDILEEYEVCSEGNIDIEYIDPSEDPSMQQKLRFMGIPQLRLNIIEKDQAAITDVYMGLAVLYGDSKEVIPALTDIATLEYELTSKILRATASEVCSIGFLAGHGEPDLQKQLSTMNSELKEQYYTQKVETSEGQKIPGDVAALVVAAPKKLSDRDLFEIDQYIMSGGKVLFLIDTIGIEGKSMQGLPLGCSIEGLVQHYGITVLPELVLDQLNAQASFQSGPYSLLIPYPFWVRTIRESVEGDHPIINGLESMVLPWASPLEIHAEKTKDKTVAVLAQSTDYSWTQKQFFDLSPREDMFPPEDMMKKQIMAVAVSGKFKSFFADMEVPPVEKMEEGEKAEDRIRPQAQKPVDEKRSVIKQSPETKIIVVGNSRFITDNFYVQFDGNRTFFLNTIDWFTIGNQLMDIRSRETGERPLYIVPEKSKTFVRFVNMFGISILLAAFGLVQYCMRRRRKSLGEIR
jgi:gliding-associated putative ABC transporter substrate-binding component GldG